MRVNLLSEPILEVKALQTVFTNKKRETTIVDGVDFEIGQNEVVALVGESGCGKSMTSLSIMQLLPRNGASKGEIRFKGRNLLDLKKRVVRRSQAAPPRASSRQIGRARLAGTAAPLSRYQP